MTVEPKEQTSCYRQNNPRIARWPPVSILRRRGSWEADTPFCSFHSFSKWCFQCLMFCLHVLDPGGMQKWFLLFILEGLELKDRYKMSGMAVPHKGQPWRKIPFYAPQLLSMPLGKTSASWLLSFNMWNVEPSIQFIKSIVLKPSFL